MKHFFAPNISGKGRVVRGIGALLLFAAAIYGFTISTWIGAVLGAFAFFVAFEALRGWCALRALGIKTRL